jgi:hypothetical protein
MFKFLKNNKTQITSLAPYFCHGQWVFDDDRFGLHREAFVCGMSEIIDYVLTDSGIDPEDVEGGFRLTFSKDKFPDSTHSLSWLRASEGGNDYVLDGLGQYGEKMEGWLCPALFHFFDKAPKKLYFSVAEFKK